jgi:hypothetical protein
MQGNSQPCKRQYLWDFAMRKKYKSIQYNFCSGFKKKGVGYSGMVPFARLEVALHFHCGGCNLPCNQTISQNYYWIAAAFIKNVFFLKLVVQPGRFKRPVSLANREAVLHTFDVRCPLALQSVQRIGYELEFS